jgi:hypothetical protein
MSPYFAVSVTLSAIVVALLFVMVTDAPLGANAT